MDFQGVMLDASSSHPVSNKQITPIDALGASSKVGAGSWELVAIHPGDLQKAS